MAKCEHRKGYDNATCILCEIDRLKKTIQSLQTENERLRKQLDEANDDMAFIMRTYAYAPDEELALSAKEVKSNALMVEEMKRLRVVEEKARAVCEKIMACYGSNEVDCSGYCEFSWSRNECPLRALEDALKGGADNADRLQD